MLWYLASLGFALWAHAEGATYESPHLAGVMIDVDKMPKKCEMKSEELDYLEVHYITRIAPESTAGKPGTKIDTSRDKDGLNDPLSIQLGKRKLIPGWEKGLLDMCEGEIRQVTIPPEHAYGENEHKTKNSDGQEIVVPAGATLRIESELVKIIRLGRTITFQPEQCDKLSVKSNKIKVHYTLWIHKSSMSGDKGKKLESSREGKKGKKGEPFEFVLGAQRVIPAWDQALEGVCVGTKLDLVVPQEFGYGMKGSPSGSVPPMATIQFEVEVLEIEAQNMFQEMDKNGDATIDFDELAAFMKKKQNMKDPEVIKKILDQEDKNKDGVIDWDEAPFPKGERPANTDFAQAMHAPKAKAEEKAEDTAAPSKSEEL